jgi:3-hydroxyacyl-[acyl-carrier-protein] dehydratase
MAPEIPDAIKSLWHRGEREPLYVPPNQSAVLDRAAVMRELPHRDPLLLIDEVCGLERERALLAARYDLSRARDVFSGHFPAYPVYPGVLQVEAIGQAGILLHQLLARSAPETIASADSAGNAGEGAPLESIALTHVLGARFLRPVTADGHLDIVAHAVKDGLFFQVVGQCLQNGRVCSVAAVSGVV